MVVGLRAEAVEIVAEEAVHRIAESSEGSEVVQEASVLVAIAGIEIGSLKREGEVRSVEEIQVDLVVQVEIRNFHDIVVDEVSGDAGIVVIESVPGVVIGDVIAHDEEDHSVSVDLVEDDIVHQVSWVMLGAVVAWEEGFVHMKEGVNS